MVIHVGTVLLADLADPIGLAAALCEATVGLQERRVGHDPGLVDVAARDHRRAVTFTDVQALADQEGLHGPAGTVASTSTIWRVLAGVDTAMLGQIRQAPERAAAYRLSAVMMRTYARPNQNACGSLFDETWNSRSSTFENPARPIAARTSSGR